VDSAAMTAFIGPGGAAKDSPITTPKARLRRMFTKFSKTTYLRFPNRDNYRHGCGKDLKKILECIKLNLPRRIALKVSDVRLFHRLANAFKERGIVPTTEDGEIVVSDVKGDVVIRNIDEVEEGVERAICLLRGKRAYDELLIGIDTNSVGLTIAVLGDGELLNYVKTDVNGVEEEMKRLVRIYPHKKDRVGVGVGNKLGELTYRILRTSFKVVRVDEDKTSKENPYIRIKDRDVRAAFAIALRAARYD